MSKGIFINYLHKPDICIKVYFSITCKNKIYVYGNIYQLHAGTRYMNLGIFIYYMQELEEAGMAPDASAAKIDIPLIQCDDSSCDDSMDYKNSATNFIANLSEVYLEMLNVIVFVKLHYYVCE